MIVYYKKAKPKSLQTQLTIWWIWGRHFANWWDAGFRRSLCCNFLGKDASLTRCCRLPLWGKKKTQKTDGSLPPFLLNLFTLRPLEQRDKTTCLVSKDHNPSPQKKQGSTGGQVLKSVKFGLDFWFLYLLDMWCWTSYLSFQGLSVLIWKMGMILPTLQGCYED